MRHQLPLVPLLILAAVAVPALSQPPPKVTSFVGDKLIQVNVSLDNSKTLSCPTDLGSFIGAYKGDGQVSSSPSFTVELGYTRGDLADLQRMRQQRLGAYHCMYMSAGGVSAYALVLTEKPSPYQIPNSNIKRVGTGPGENSFQPYCKLPAGDNSELVWETYKDSSGMFEERATGRMLTLSYTTLSREHGNGMTIYRCYNKRNPEVIEYHWAMYSDNLQIRPVRASNYETTPLPYNVRYQSVITLECHGNGSVTGAVRPSWLFKRDGADAYVPVANDPPALEMEFQGTLSTLTIQRMMPRYSGYYKCNKDNINHAVRLRVNYGDVIIRDYSKTVYPLKQDNYITCEIPEKSLKEQATFTLHRSGLPPLVLKGATTVEGFTTSFDSQDNLAIRFAKRSDMEKARLVCSFHGTSDFTVIQTVLPKLTLEDTRTGATYFYFTCKKDRDFGTTRDLKVHPIMPDGSYGAEMTIYPSNIKEARFYMARTDAKKYYEFVCVSSYEGNELKSNVLTFGTPDVSVDLHVDGEKNPSRRVFLGGRDVTIECIFNRVPSSRRVVPSSLSLLKDERKSPLPQELVNATAFRYVIRNAGSSDNGNYRCDYANSGLYRAGSNLIGNFRSPSSNLQFCTGSQFVCDMTCKDVSLMCDKKRDCADGADERPEYCEKCEPNEVKCQTHNGRSPEKRCVLKHWLCDGQDDCGNGYDENMSLHSKWCFKEKNCAGCRPEETCCPNFSNKCIQRNYECDKENDCDGGTEELRCSVSQCLRLTEPTARQIVRKRVGDTFNMTCRAVGMDRPTINWRRNWAALPKDGITEANEVTGRDFTGEYTVLGTLQFERVTKDASGIYNCEAVNNCKRVLSYEIDLRVSD